MTKNFVIFLKALAFVVGCGYVVFLMVPLIGNLIFTINLGGIGNIFSAYYISLYLAVLLSIIVLFILIKICKITEGKKVLNLLIVLLLLISVYHVALAVWNSSREASFEANKSQALQEKEAFLRDHCTKISEEDAPRSKTVYKCDDGSIR